MIINTQIKLLDLKGEILKDNGIELILGDLLANMLIYTPSDNQYKSWLLAKKISSANEIDLSSDDIVFIKEIMKKSNMLPVSAGQAISILEGKSNE